MLVAESQIAVQRGFQRLARAEMVALQHRLDAVVIMSGNVIHIDATLIRADVGLACWSNSIRMVDLANPDEEDRLSRSTGKIKKLCVTAPEATMATRSRQLLLPFYKQHLGR